MFRSRAHLLLCTGPRCRDRGAQALFDETWVALEREGLAYYKPGGSLRLTESGCLGACQHGPNLTCYGRTEATGCTFTEAWYAGMTREAVLHVARALHHGAPLPDAGRYG